MKKRRKNSPKEKQKRGGRKSHRISGMWRIFPDVIKST